VVLPPLHAHLFGLYEPSLGICYLLTPELEISFTPEAVRLLRHSVERCLLRPGAVNVRQSSEPSASVSADVDSDFFSERQLKVLRLLANGYSNTDIGKELAISASLAKQEVAFIMHSLQARNRLDAVVKAQRRGIIPSVSAQV
jgi:DNA-binding NarL/FixJ family response regulator